MGKEIMHLHSCACVCCLQFKRFSPLLTQKKKTNKQQIIPAFACWKDMTWKNVLFHKNRMRQIENIFVRKAPDSKRTGTNTHTHTRFTLAQNVSAELILMVNTMLAAGTSTWFIAAPFSRRHRRAQANQHNEQKICFNNFIFNTTNENEVSRGKMRRRT